MNGLCLPVPVEYAKVGIGGVDVTMASTESRLGRGVSMWFLRCKGRGEGRDGRRRGEDTMAKMEPSSPNESERDVIAAARCSSCITCQLGSVSKLRGRTIQCLNTRRAPWYTRSTHPPSSTAARRGVAHGQQRITVREMEMRSKAGRTARLERCGFGTHLNLD